MNIEPTGNRVLIKRTDEKTRTDSGIILIGNSMKPTKYATVLAVGPDVKRIMVSNKVFFSEYSGIEIKFEGTDYVVLTEDDIFAIVK